MRGEPAWCCIGFLAAASICCCCLVAALAAFAVAAVVGFLLVVVFAEAAADAAVICCCCCCCCCCCWRLQQPHGAWYIFVWSYVHYVASGPSSPALVASASMRSMLRRLVLLLLSCSLLLYKCPVRRHSRSSTPVRGRTSEPQWWPRHGAEEGTA